jgi:hypothetical protein
MSKKVKAASLSRWGEGGPRRGSGEGLAVNALGSSPSSVAFGDTFSRPGEGRSLRNPTTTWEVKR